MSVRVGFIGTGGIAQSHLSTLTRIPEAELVALCDVSVDRVEAAKARFAEGRRRRLGDSPDAAALAAAEEAEKKVNSAKAYGDYRQMLESENLDAVYICLPPFVHG